MIVCVGEGGAWCIHSQLSVPMVPHPQMVNIQKKSPRKFQKAKFEFATCWQLFILHLQILTWHIECIRQFMLSRDDFKYLVACTQVICKYYIILYKGVQHLKILVWRESPGTNCPWILRNDWTCICAWNSWLLNLLHLIPGA